MIYFSASKKKIISKNKNLIFNLAGLEVINSSALISYAVQVQVLLRNCQTNLINSCYIAFSLYSTIWLRLSHFEDNLQQGDIVFVSFGIAE